MDRTEMEDALRELATRPAPELSASFERGVWQVIHSRGRDAAGRGSVLDTLFGAIMHPGWAASAAAVAIFVSATFEAAQAPVAHASASSSDLAVFSADAPTLPSSILFHE